MQHIYDSLSMTKSAERFSKWNKNFCRSTLLWVTPRWSPIMSVISVETKWAFFAFLIFMIFTMSCFKGHCKRDVQPHYGPKTQVDKKSGILNIQWFSTKCFEPWKFCNKFQIPDRGLSATCCSLKTQRCKTLVKGSCWGRPRGLLRMGRTWTSRSRPGGATRFDTKLIYFLSIPLSPGIPVAPRKSPLVNWKWRNRNSTRRGEGELQQEQLQGHLEGRHQVGEWSGAKAEWK